MHFRTPKPTPTPTPTPKPTPMPTPAPGSLTSLGTFKITYYGPTGHNTYTGTACEQGKTVAVDPSVIPLGTKIYIEGSPLSGYDGYFTAEDTGSAVQGKIIDIYADDGESSSYGTGSYTVYIVN